MKIAVNSVNYIGVNKMSENETIVTMGFDSNGLPQASIKATGEPYERVLQDAKELIEFLTDYTLVGNDVEYSDDEDEDDPEDMENELGFC